MPVISSVSLLFRSGQGKLTYATVFRISKGRISAWKDDQNCASRGEHLKWEDFSQPWVCHSWEHRLQQAWVTADATAKPDSGSAGIRHWKPQWLKRASGGNCRQKTQTACNVLIIFKTKHVAKNVRGLTAFQRLGGTKLPSLNGAVSVNHHLYRETWKEITQTFLEM